MKTSDTVNEDLLILFWLQAFWVTGVMTSWPCFVDRQETAAWWFPQCPLRTPRRCSPRWKRRSCHPASSTCVSHPSPEEVMAVVTCFHSEAAAFSTACVMGPCESSFFNERILPALRVNFKRENKFSASPCEGKSWNWVNCRFYRKSTQKSADITVLF